MRSVSFGVCATLLLAGAGLAGCQPTTVTDSSRAIYCEVQAEAPNRDNDDAPKKIIAVTRFRCEPPGASTMDLTMRLQHQNAQGTWVDLATLAFTAKGTNTVPGKGEAFKTKEVSAGCGTGAFRTRVTGKSTARGKTKTYDINGPRSFDPCHPGVFAQK